MKMERKYFAVSDLVIVERTPPSDAELGDWVRLKSGGPAMLVSGVSQQGTALKASWRDGEAVVWGTFSRDVLCRL